MSSRESALAYIEALKQLYSDQCLDAAEKLAIANEAKALARETFAELKERQQDFDAGQYTLDLSDKPANPLKGQKTLEGAYEQGRNAMLKAIADAGDNTDDIHNPKNPFKSGSEQWTEFDRGVQDAMAGV